MSQIYLKILQNSSNMAPQADHEQRGPQFAFYQSHSQSNISIIFSSMRTSQAFIHDHLLSFDSEHEWIVTSRNDQTIVINAISFDEFYPFRLVPRHHRKQCKGYETRQQYALPSTPKIILVANANRPDDELLMLAQRGQFEFQKLVAHHQNMARGTLELMLQVIIVAEMLQRKYGYFKFTENMIRASKGPALLVWISENQASNQPQLPIEAFHPINLQKNQKSSKDNRDPMRTMILSLFAVFQRRICNPIIAQIMKQEKEQITFQYVKKRIGLGIKEQVLSQCTIGTPQTDKYRRYTQQKRRKIPQFLLNKTNIKKGSDKQKYKSQQDSINKKGQTTYSHHHPSPQNESKDQGSGLGIRKIAATRMFKQRQTQAEKDRKLILLSLLKKTNENILGQKLQTSKTVSDQSIKLENQVMRFTDSYRGQGQEEKEEGKQIRTEIFKKDEKIVVRDSGKSISTSSANYFSINGSGKRFYYSNKIGEEEQISYNSCSRKKQTISDSFYSKNSTKISKKDRSSFFKQLAKPEIKVSKIIEENHEEIQLQSQSQTHSGRSPRSPSILQAVFYNESAATQQSLASPGSEFYKDVDCLLHSGAISPKMSSEIDNTIEGQLHNILFD